MKHKNNQARVVIAGTQSGVGKTTAALGLLAALSGRMQVQPYKVGPDYIDTAYHTFITGRKSRNLDGWLLDEETVLYLFQKNMVGADIAVIEGVMGLFDGAEISSDKGSTAQIAKIIKAPVILVIDAAGMSVSAAAMVQGYQKFDGDLDVTGVIFNRVSGERHYLLLKEAVESYTGLKAFGYLPKDEKIELSSRHLGLLPSVEMPQLKEKIGRLAQMVEKTVEVDEIVNHAKAWNKSVPAFSSSSATDFSAMSAQGSEVDRQPAEIAVANDEAFNFYYWDNLDLLREAGVKPVFFSPLRDEALPEGVKGLWLGGGFPEVFARELAENTKMKQSIKAALAAGMPYHAECGGLMYLLEELEDFAGERFAMTGWLRGTCQMTQRLQRFGYALLELKDSCLWGKKGDAIKIHEFHHSKVSGEEERTVFKLSKLKNKEVERQWECGYIKGNGTAGYPHLHLYSNLSFAENFVVRVKSRNQQ